MALQADRGQRIRLDPGTSPKDHAAANFQPIFAFRPGGLKSQIDWGADTHRPLYNP